VYFGTGRHAAWVREDCQSEGLERNILATIMGLILGGVPVPILGPAAITQIAGEASGGYVVGVAEGFDDGQCQAFLRIGMDCRWAIDGHDDGFSYDTMDAEWAANVRKAAEWCHDLDIPQNYPYCMAAAPDDDVATILRRLGLGQQFAPVPIRA
jgi:hypothetical protein